PSAGRRVTARPPGMTSTAQSRLFPPPRALGSGGMSLGEVAADLYGRTLAEFVAARNEQVRAAKAAGDKELAADIAGLRKPTVAAWTVNMLVHAAPDEAEIGRASCRER